MTNRKVVRIAAAQMLLHSAQSRNWTMKVDDGGDEYAYVGTDAKKAGEAVRAVYESTVHFYQPDGQMIGWAIIIPSLAPDETIADYGVAADAWGDEFHDLCKSFSEAAGR